MRIATWNINGLRARLDYLCLWLASRAPDVVGLQELKLEADAFPHERFAELGYRAVVHSEKSWNGVAVLSREPARVIGEGLPGQEDFGARLIDVDVAGLRFATAYCPNGKSLDHADYERKLIWFDALTAYVAKHWKPDQPAVLCGDFNIAPAPLDSWQGSKGDGSLFHTQAERQRFGALLDAGFVDLYRQRHPDGKDFSWWDYRGGAFHRGHGLRIDTLLATPSVAGRLKEVVIDRDFRKKQDGLTASDHAPVYADLSHD
ncbi:MAG: exodeoxyribonuclease III [Gammaproteobacteria bacterium]|nr:exodeoxyribonuclease III [Gammaproteobacteria bacterium]